MYEDEIQTHTQKGRMGLDYLAWLHQLDPTKMNADPNFARANPKTLP